MGKNTILNITIFSCRLIRICYVLLGTILLAFFIHIQTNRSFYDNFYWKESEPKNTFTNVIHLKIKINDKIDFGKNPNTYPLSSITTFSLYYTFFQLLAILTLFYLATFEFQKVVESVKNLKTFQERNVKAFRRIGNYFLAILLISIYTHIAFGDKFVTELKLNFTGIFQILIVFILAEIFKEGNKLQEENQLTV